MTTTVTARTYVILVALTLGLTAFAQPPAPVYHPGDTIKLTVTFEGPDANKIHGAAFSINSPEAPRDQPGFGTNLYASESTPGTTPNTFVVSIKIPDGQATGDYKLALIRGIANKPDVSVDYRPSEFKETTFRIENSQHLTKPIIKDIKVP